jgi:hypothetical protein
MQVSTCLSLLKFFDKATVAKIPTQISTYKCPYVGYARNILTAMFLESNFEYQLFIDADVSFEPEAVGGLILAQKDFVCAPYRRKTPDDSVKYSVSFKDFQHIDIDKKGLVEITGGPAGLTLIHRSVYEKLMKKYPDLKINNEMTISEGAKKYLYNFWENTFDSKKGEWRGEDVSFCELIKKEGIKMYATVNSEIGHHGTYNFKGKIVDTFKPRDDKSN